MNVELSRMAACCSSHLTISRCDMQPSTTIKAYTLTQFHIHVYILLSYSRFFFKFAPDSHSVIKTVNCKSHSYWRHDAGSLNLNWGFYGFPISRKSSARDGQSDGRGRNV